MGAKLTLARIPAFFQALVVTALRSILFASQVQQRPPNLIETLNEEAEANDPAGIRVYSQHLIRLLVGDRVGKAHAASLSHRLAHAETMARHRKQNLVSEADVARSFNDLMKKIGAPASLSTNEAWVQKFRAGLLAGSAVPALISTDRNGAYCNPGEAVLLLFLLLANNGSFDDHLPDGLKPESLPRVWISSRQPTEPTSWGLLSAYHSQHSRDGTIYLFENAAQTLHL